MRTGLIDGRSLFNVKVVTKRGVGGLGCVLYCV